MAEHLNRTSNETVTAEQYHPPERVPLGVFTDPDGTAGGGRDYVRGPDGFARWLSPGEWVVVDRRGALTAVPDEEFRATHTGPRIDTRDLWTGV